MKKRGADVQRLMSFMNNSAKKMVWSLVFVFGVAIGGCDKDKKKTTPPNGGEEKPFVVPDRGQTGDSPGLAKGKSLFQQKSFTAALREFDGYIKKHPEDARGHYYRSICLQALQRPKQAIEALKKAVARKPSFPEKYNNLAGLLIQNGDFSAAIRVLEAAVKKFSGETSLWYNLGLAYLFKKEFSSAARALDRASKGGAASPKIYMAAGVAHLKDGQTEVALKRFKKALAGGVNAGAEEGAAKCLLALGKTKKALLHAKKAAELSPGNPARLHLYGLTLLATGQPKEAIKEFQRASARVPKSVSVQVGWARALLAAGKKKDALAKIKAIETQAQGKGGALFGEVLLVKAEVFVSKGKCGRVRSILGQVRRLIDKDKRLQERLKKASSACKGR